MRKDFKHMPSRPGYVWLDNICICKQLFGQFEKGYYACPVACHDKKVELKGETSNELTAVGGFEFNRVRP